MEMPYFFREILFYCFFIKEGEGYHLASPDGEQNYQKVVLSILKYVVFSLYILSAYPILVPDTFLPKSTRFSQCPYRMVTATIPVRKTDPAGGGTMNATGLAGAATAAGAAGKTAAATPSALSAKEAAELRKQGDVKKY